MCDPPKGLKYYTEVHHGTSYNDVEVFITNLDLHPINYRGSKRQVAHFGYKYDYYNNRVDIPTDEFPATIRSLADILYEFTDIRFNQCIINRYLPGEGISAHIDDTKYGPTIAAFTIGYRKMRFISPSGDIYEQWTEPESLYIMSGESRSTWKHAMQSVKWDTVKGIKYKRETCYSITFRTVIE